jgi:hypothetical protein
MTSNPSRFSRRIWVGVGPKSEKPVDFSPAGGAGRRPQQRLADFQSNLKSMNIHEAAHEAARLRAIEPTDASCSAVCRIALFMHCHFCVNSFFESFILKSIVQNFCK